MNYFKIIGCLLIVFIIIISCDNNEISIQQQPVKTNADSFRADVTKFQFTRYKVYKNHMDLFLVENSFYKKLMEKYKEVYLFPMHIFHNSFDTLRERRQMLLLDTNGINYSAIVPDNEFTRKFAGNLETLYYVDSRIMGFKITDDKEDPGLETPTFYIQIDSIHEK